MTAAAWLPIAGYPGYEVSRHGQVRRGARVLIDRSHPRGYRIVDLSRDGKATSKTVHKLVCVAFHGPAFGRQVNHIDGDKAANGASNLEWSTARENTQHAIAMGRHPASRALSAPGSAS